MKIKRGKVVSWAKNWGWEKKTGGKWKMTANEYRFLSGATKLF